MLIWILAFLLFAGIGLIGYSQGAVRLLVSLVGLFLGAIFAIPLSSTVRPLVVLAGVKHAVWLAVLPPVVVFLVFLAAFMAIAYAVHRKTELHFKYKSDDYHFAQWGILNKRLGTVIGVFMGAVWLLILGLVIHIAGYLTVQVSSENAGSIAIRMLNQARKDLRDTGLEKSVAAIDPIAKTKYYPAADVLGLVYNNPILMGRLSQYPPFLSFGDRPEFQELASDTEYNSLLLSKAEFTDILKHPKTQSILQNSEIIAELRNQDFSDLKTYLESGNSPKFADLKILGRWKLDSYSSMARHRKKNPDMTAAELIRARKMLTETLASVTFLATPDNKAVLRAEASAPATPPPDESAAPPPSRDPRYGGMSPDLAQRYGGLRGGAPPARPSAPPAQPQPPAVEIIPPVRSAQGSWELRDGNYVIELQAENGKQDRFTASAEEDQLIINAPRFDLVFEKTL